MKSEIATFFEAFPDGIVWGNTVGGEGYDIVLRGQVEPARIDVDKMQRCWRSPEFAVVGASRCARLASIRRSALLSTYGGTRPS